MRHGTVDPDLRARRLDQITAQVAHQYRAACACMSREDFASIVDAIVKLRLENEELRDELARRGVA
jgi:hypothetical protein